MNECCRDALLEAADDFLAEFQPEIEFSPQEVWAWLRARASTPGPCCFPGCHPEWNPHPIPCPDCSTAAGARTPGLASTPLTGARASTQTPATTAEPRRGCGPWTETSPGVSICGKCGDINFTLEDDDV